MRIQEYFLAEESWRDCIGLCSVLRPRQHSIGYMGDGFYRSKDPTNSIKVLKEHTVHREIRHTIIGIIKGNAGNNIITLLPSIAVHTCEMWHEGMTAIQRLVHWSSDVASHLIHCTSNTLYRVRYIDLQWGWSEAFSLKKWNIIFFGSMVHNMATISYKPASLN